jgi:hypothetical protein
MDTKTIYKNHISIDQNFILKLSRENALKDKEDFFKILKCWIRFSKSETIGDLTKMIRRTPLLFLRIGSSTYYINADSKRTGVEEFLNNTEESESWRIIFNEDGVKNKITNRKDEEAIPGFYFYKEI